MAVRQGTGFTNINRILQANRGSKLGGAVTGGIAGSVQGVQSGIKSAQDQFQEEANKNRLDTDESKQQRQSVLNKFDPSKNAPDTTNFVPSTGLTTKYETEKTAYQKQQEDQAKQYQEQEKARQDELSRLQGLKFTPAMVQPVNTGFTSKSLANRTRVAQAQAAIKDKERQKSIRQLNEFSGIAKGAYDAQVADLQSKLGTLDTDYAKMSQAEKDAYIASETEKNALANMPTEDEIKGFNRFATGTYSGPTELQDSASLLSKAQQAESLGNLAKSGGGRQELLRQFVGGRDYTQGQRNVDSLILGRDPSVNLGAAARQTRGAVEDVQQANRGASNQALEYVNRAKEFGDETRGMVEQTKAPLSGSLDERIVQTQQAEAARAAKIKEIQDLIAGQGDQYKGFENMARLGMGLSDASESGMLSKEDASFLVGSGDRMGLLQRGADLGLDVNTLLNERFKNVGAENLSRTGVASASEAARLNALNRMLGKTGTDLEFSENRGQFKSGAGNFDLRSLEDYITREEQKKAESDPVYAGQLEAQKARYLDQTLAYGGEALGNAKDLVGLDATKAAGLGAMATPLALSGAVGGLSGATAAGVAGSLGATAGAMSPIALAAMLGLDTVTGGDTTAKTMQSTVDTGLAGVGAVNSASDALTEGLAKLNIGGNSFANTEAGKQFLKALEFKNQMQNEALKGTSKLAQDWTGGIGGLTKDGLSDISSGNFGNILKNYYGATGGKSLERGIGDLSKMLGIKGASLNNLGKDIKTSLFGGKTGDWSTDRLSTVDATTGKGTTIGSFANRSSDDIMKQIQADVSKGILGKVEDKSKYGTGHQRIGTLMNYYKAAKAREDAASAEQSTLYKNYTASDEDLKTDIDYSSKDVQKFMDRIKPASYNYKEEVKDSPLASKNRELGVMAQDLEKSKLGKEAVHNTPEGKIVDYNNLEPKMLASLASLNERLKRIEGKK